MTTPWIIPPDLWAGETVAVLGAGPDLEAQLVDLSRDMPTIACNRSVMLAPWATVFVGLDPGHPFWGNSADFKGMKVIGVLEPDMPDALYAGMFYETVHIAPGHTIQIRNNALAAIRIAAMAGAAKIILLGFDCAAYEAAHAHTGFYGLTQGLEQITAELRAKGIEVERVDSTKQVKAKRGNRPA